MHRYEVTGVINKTSDTTVEITELPIKLGSTAGSEEDFTSS